jgi:hypothetical protein
VLTSRPGKAVGVLQVARGLTGLRIQRVVLAVRLADAPPAGVRMGRLVVDIFDGARIIQGDQEGLSQGGHKG